VTRWAGLLVIAFTAGCSGLDEGAGGVVGLQVQEPASSTLEVGESLQLTAVALDKDGNPVDAEISWRAPDPTLTVDPLTGVITGVAPGQGQVQAFAGSLASPLLTFTVIARPDTLVIVGDSVVTVAPTDAGSIPLVVQVQSFSPAGPVASWPVIYTITSPPDIGGPHTVELPGGVLADTLTTGTDGAVPGVTLNRVAGIAQPDTAIVEVRASRTRGEPVPGSGQRFIVIIQ
jgi:hypothetical protein